MYEGPTDWKKSTWQNMYKMNKHIAVIHEIYYINLSSVHSKPVLLQYQKLEFWCCGHSTWTLNDQHQKCDANIQMTIPNYCNDCGHSKGTNVTAPPSVT
jgi:hypothetical protein